MKIYSQPVLAASSVPANAAHNWTDFHFSAGGAAGNQHYDSSEYQQWTCSVLEETADWELARID
jgi:hypothetical protein